MKKITCILLIIMVYCGNGICDNFSHNMAKDMPVRKKGSAFTGRHYFLGYFSKEFEMETVNERWKRVMGFSDYYVSDTGRVKSFKWKRPHFLLQQNKRGYMGVCLGDGHCGRWKQVHRLVLEAFIGLPPQGYECNHKNGHKSDNRLANLEWVTPSENQKHAYRTGLQVHSMQWCKQRSLDNRGQGNGRAKLADSDIPEIRKLSKDGMKCIKIADRYLVSPATIYFIVKGHTWKHIK